MTAPLHKRLRRELRVRALLFLLPLLRRLPSWLVRPLAVLAGSAAYLFVGRERRLALDHLRLAYPDAAPSFHRRVARLAFVSLVQGGLEVAAAARLQPRLRELVRLGDEDRALLAAAHGEGKGVLFASCHLGNWELLARRIVLEGYRCGTVAREAQDPRLTGLLEAARAEVGLLTLWRGRPGLAKELLRLLRSGAFVGMLIDQDTAVQGVFVPFFGRPAHTPRAIGDLAVRTGAPVVFGCIHREGSHHRSHHRVVLRRIPVPSSGDREADAVAVTRAATEAIEREVRERPDEWVWMHRRWKTRPAQVPVSDPDSEAMSS
jgi:Kdo2-lipid IVA lauroyltransferase/acyltransferase